MGTAHFARSSGLAALVAAAAAAPLTAQSPFEGEITLTSPMYKAPLLLQAKGKAWRVVGMDADLSATISGADGVAYVVALKKPEYWRASLWDARYHADDLATSTYKPTGKSDTIAGIACQYYVVHDADEPDGEHQECITGELGYLSSVLGYVDAGWKLGGGASVGKQFPKGMFTLKASDLTGPSMLVTKVERKAMPDSLFRPPAGFKQVDPPVARAMK